MLRIWEFTVFPASAPRARAVDTASQSRHVKAVVVGRQDYRADNPYVPTCKENLTVGIRIRLCATGRSVVAEV